MGVVVETRFDTQLNGAISDVDTSLTLDAAPANTTGYGTLERGEANEEDVYWGGLSGLQLTSLLRGLSQTALTNTEVAGNKKAHVDNAQFEGTLLHYIINDKASKSGNEAVTGSWSFNTQLPTSTDTPGANAELTTKVYVDTADNLKANLSGGNTFSGTNIFPDGATGPESTTNAAPASEKKLANKKYVDDQVAAVSDTKVKVSSDDTTADYLGNKIDNDANSYLTWAETSPAGDEGFRGTINATQSSSGSASANKLGALDSAGHWSNTMNARTFTAYEAISQYDAVCLLPVEVQWYDQLTSASLAIGDSNVRRKHAIKIIPTQTTSTLTTMQFRAAEAVNGATTLGNLTWSIQTNGSNEPSGTAVSNGTATAISQATQRTWNTTQGTRTATWAASPTLTAGTTYWLVYECAATDGANYLNFGVNSSHDENYHTFTRLTYNLDTGTWGTSTTNATPFFWFNNQEHLLGDALAQADSNWGARTWNFIGFASAAISANASGEVQHSMASLTGLTPNKRYYLSTTAGQITTSPSGAAYEENTEPSSFLLEVGRSFSTTELKVDPGEKRVMIRESTVLSATTTRQYVLWFRPDVILVNGGGLVNSGASEGASSNGYDVWGADGAVGLTTGPTTAGSGFGDTSNSFATAGSGMVANATYSDAGFTYTITETGTANATYIIEAKAH